MCPMYRLRAACTRPFATFRQDLHQARYDVPHDVLGDTDVAVTPLLGFGRADNVLNDVLLALLRGARRRVILLTPYFNLPRPVRLVLGQLLRRGCRSTSWSATRPPTISTSRRRSRSRPSACCRICTKTTCAALRAHIATDRQRPTQCLSVARRRQQLSPERLVRR
jgi:phosphatidylserine/phosphatidylglycerophosphate/cardiolipin synthase-like enzyme